MSKNNSELAIAFLESQPSAAAAILEQQPVEQVAAFIKGVPYKQAAIVLKKMLPQYIANLCAELEPNISAGFLSEMDASLVAAIMRNTDKTVSGQFFELLPDRTKLTCNLLLNYSETDVGAWMTTDFFSVPDDCDVATALKRLASTAINQNLEMIYVVNRDRELIGRASTSFLYRSSLTTLVRSLAKPIEPVSGRASLSSLSEDTLWNSVESVPVVNRNRQLVGVLRHIDLRNGLEATSGFIEKPVTGDSIGGIIEAYSNTLVSFFESVSDVVNIRKT